MSLVFWGITLTATNSADAKPPAVRLMGRDELNIAEFPIALLSPQASTQTKTIECRRQILLPSGQYLDQEWIVTGSDRFGLPLPGDQDILLALLKLATDVPAPTPKVYFSRYEVLEILGLGQDGKNKRRVTEAIQRYWSTRIATTNSFWSKQRKEWTSHKGLSIIDEYEILERPTRSGEAREQRRLSWVEFGQQFFESLVSGYVKPLDLTMYFSFRHNATKRLYRYLDKHRYRRSTHSIGLIPLAEVHVGFSGSVLDRAATIKRALEPAHAELLERGFLKDVAFNKNRDGDWKILYTFGSPKDLPEQLSLPTVEEPQSPLLQSLIQRGISPKNAEALAAAKPHQYIEEQLEAFDYLLRLGSTRPIHNPAGFLTQAIRDNWRIAPPGFKSRREREERDRTLAAEASRRTEADLDEHRRQDAAHQLRESLPPDTIAALRAEAVAEVRRQFGGGYKVRENGPVVEAFMNGLIRERYLHQTVAS